MTTKCSSASTRKNACRLGVAALCIGALAAPSQAQSPGELALAIREVWCLDYETLAALDVSAQSFEEIALEAVRIAREKRETLIPLLKTYAAASEDLAEREALEDLPTFTEVVRAARAAVQAEVEELLTYGMTRMTEAQRALHTHSLANQGLPPVLSLIDLTDNQRADLWERTCALRVWLRNPMRWHRQTEGVDALGAFWQEVDCALNTEQRTMLVGLQETAESNSAWMLEREGVVAASAGE